MYHRGERARARRTKYHADTVRPPFAGTGEYHFYAYKIQGGGGGEKEGGGKKETLWTEGFLPFPALTGRHCSPDVRRRTLVRLHAAIPVAGRSAGGHWDGGSSLPRQFHRSAPFEDEVEEEEAQTDETEYLRDESQGSPARRQEHFEPAGARCDFLP